MEKRILGMHGLRASRSGDRMTVSGYAATYNTLSKDLGGFRERIAPEAFRRILATNPDVVCLFNHDMNSVLGRTSAGTLRLSEDRKGLAFECDLPNTTVGRDLPLYEEEAAVPYEPAELPRLFASMDEEEASRCTRRCRHPGYAGAP